MNKGDLTAGALNRLLEIHTSRINAYRKAINKARKMEQDVKIIFEKMIQESIQFKRDLSTRLLATNKTEVLEEIRGVDNNNEWIGTKAINTGDRDNILTGCELDEERVGDAYIMALKSDAATNPAIGELLISQLESSEMLRHHIKKCHATQ